MRGRPGDPVKLLVRHADELDPVDITIVREVIVVQSVLGDTRREDGAWEYHLEQDPRIGYLRITTFGKHTVEELQNILADSPYEALLIDLRGNAGGLLNAAVETCDLFIATGPIVSTRGREGVVRHTYPATGQTAVESEMPIAVLVNGFSASASEIVSACLQDYGRAVVVGDRTWGKGTVQNILEMEGGQSALRLTTATYWRPSGENIHRHKEADETEAWGVRPNEGFEVVYDEEEAMRVFEDRRARDINRRATPEEPVVDRQLERALDYLDETLGETGAAAA
jgi:carboxyl-terminal processing protease